MIERFDEERLRRAYTTATAHTATAHNADCPSGEELLAAVRGEGEEQQRLQVLDRALRCPACRSELALLRSVSEPGARGQRTFTWQRLVPLAAAASIVFVFGVVTMDRLRERQNALRGDDGQPALIAPGNSSVPASAPVAFVWHPVERALRYTLEVYASDGTVLLSQATKDTTLIAQLQNVPAGQNRWTVRAHLDDGGERRSEVRVLRLR
jgi:hypothetical protein